MLFRSYSDYKFSDTKKLFLTGDIQLITDHLYFKKMLIDSYHKTLHRVLKDAAITSVLIKIKFIDGQFRTIGTRCGFSFNYDYMVNWDFEKSDYYHILKSHKSLCKPDIKLAADFDYTFSNHPAPLNLDQLFARLFGFLLDLEEEYEFSVVDYFVISFTPIRSDKRKPLIKNINNIPLKSNISNIKDIRKIYKDKFLPLTLDESFYGKRSYSTRSYIDPDNKIKRVVTNLSPYKTRKDVYYLNTNQLIESFIDEMIDVNSFTRTSEKTNSSVTIRNDKLVRTSVKTNLPFINPIIQKEYQNTFNKNIGAFDIETFYNKKTGKDEVYALGFAYGGNNVMVLKPKAKMFYLDEGLTSSDIVIKCIKEMLATKYKNTIFYTHNLGGFDVVFILKILGDYNSSKNIEPKNRFKLKAFLRDNRILKLKISLQISKSVNNTIFLVDSYPLLPTSLASLAEGFSTKYEKPLFPYSFISHDNLYYVGNIPSIDYYGSIKKNEITPEEYRKLAASHKSDWDLKAETLKYLESDLIGLLQIMYEFSHHIFDVHNIQVTECLTITGLAIKIFLTNHYPKKSLALIRNPAIYNDIKKGYAAGLSEVYIGYGEDLYYYDVNSLYPFGALNDMPGNECTYIECHTEGEYLDIRKDELFGFFYADIKTNTNDYIGLLPVKHEGLLTYPLGEFSG